MFWKLRLAWRIGRLDASCAQARKFRHRVRDDLSQITHKRSAQLGKLTGLRMNAGGTPVMGKRDRQSLSRLWISACATHVDGKKGAPVLEDAQGHQGC